MKLVQRTGRRPVETGVAALVAALLLVCAAGTAAAAPPAGTPIGNQASASYLDASSTPRTATSNLVTTIVQQVASFTLTADGANTSAPGGQAIFPHTLTNTGNGTDDFPLTLANLVGDDFDLTSLAMHIDAGGDGVPDDFVALTGTGPLAAGAVFRFVVVGSVPGVQIGGQIARARVSAVSAFDGAQTGFNTDVVTVTGNAVISVTKSANPGSGPSPFGPVDYTVQYTNTGNSAATALRITDVIPAGMTYVPGSGRWSVTGAAVLTDANNADAQGIVPNTIVYDYGVTGAGTVTATVAQVPPGATGTVTFQVNVDPGLPPITIDNSAVYAYFDGAANVGPFTTNLAPYVVDRAVALSFVGQTIPAANQGATIAFSNLLTNQGNGSDVFNIVVDPGSTFPAGTTYALFRADGVTPLTDSNGDAVPDQMVSASSSEIVVLRVTLPPAATGGPFTVTKTATSLANSAQYAAATDELTVITASTVDLTNNAAGAGAPGAGPGPEASAVITNAVNPGATTRFDLYVNNTGPISDAFDLAVSTDPSFTTVVLPAGWSVTFLNAALAPITGTGSIAAGGNMLVHADVTVPAGYAAGTVQIYFRSRSPVTTAEDRKRDAVTVNPVRSLNIVPNNSGQTNPGGSVIYTHLLSNNGNVIEGDGAGSVVTLATGNDQVGWSSVLYHDTNGNGVLDGADVAISDLGAIGGVAPGVTARLFVHVFSPAGAPLGQVNTTTATATTSNVTYTSPVPPPAIATDVTTVINGQLQLVKQQALDVNCDGVIEGAYTLLNLGIGAIPGACLRYEITVTNVGTAPVTGVVVSDATPPNTTYSAAIPASTTVGTIVPPPAGSVGTITATVGTLGPGQSAVIVFGIRIDP